MNNILNFSQYKNKVNESVFALPCIAMATLILGITYLTFTSVKEFEMDVKLIRCGEEIKNWFVNKLKNVKIIRILSKIKMDPEYKALMKERNPKNHNWYLNDLERIKAIIERNLDEDEIDYLNDFCGDRYGDWISRMINHNGDFIAKDSDGNMMMYCTIDEDCAPVESNAIFEEKSTRDLVKDLARRLSVDKDVVKYLNTSRAKREIGWRELLAQKLHGKNLDYINYITKTMVADYNPQITGYIPVDRGAEDFDLEHEEELKGDEAYDDLPIDDKLNNLNKRVRDIETVLAIDTDDDGESVERATKELGLAELAKEEDNEEPEEE